MDKAGSLTGVPAVRTFNPLGEPYPYMSPGTIQGQTRQLRDSPDQAIKGQTRQSRDRPAKKDN
jgi:hypothetical protein